MCPLANIQPAHSPLSLSQNGLTALMAAVSNSHFEVIRLLLDRGAHIETRDKVGNSPLAIACSLGHLENVNLLLRRHANVHARDIVSGLSARLAVCLLDGDDDAGCGCDRTDTRH